MRIRTLKLLIRIFLFALILPLALLAAFPQALRCYFIEYSADFVETAPNLFVSVDTPPPHRLALMMEFELARRRLERFWMSPRQGRAQVIFCLTDGDYGRYCPGGEGAGCSLGTPWGESWIVVNPHGRNADVLAHELCHDELFARLGWLRTHRQIPEWFNEGLALMLDHRFAAASASEKTDSLQRARDYQDEWESVTGGRQIILSLDELETTRDFFSGDSGRRMIAYMTAGREVSRWLSVVGRPGLRKLLDEMKQGSDFPATYRRLELDAKKRTSPLPESQ